MNIYRIKDARLMKFGGNISYIIRIIATKKILASEVINVLGGQNRGYSYSSISISTKLRMHRLKKFAEKSFSQNRDYSKKYFCWPPRSLPSSEVKKQAIF